MTKPLVTFADPEALVVNYYKTVMAARPEAYAPDAANVSVSFPDVALSGDITHLQVELESGNVADYPVTERAQVRVTAYAGPGRRTVVKNLATLAQAVLYGHPGDANVAGFVPLIGRSEVVTDPTTKNLMVWFLFRADLLATQLAS